MKPLRNPLVLLALPLMLTGCIFLPGEDDPCNDVDYGQAEPAPVQEQRNPTSGQCEAFGGGGGGGGRGGGGSCGDEWGGGPALEQAPEPDVDWALCYQQCEGLDETSCIGTSGCRAAYIEQWGAQSFYECWGTAPSGPVQGGGCVGLDAQACSRHDDCSAVHGAFEAPGGDGGFTNAIADFERCIEEDGMQGCYGDSECGDGFHCNADTECLPDPSCGGGGGEADPIPCDAVCYGFCVPDEQPDPGTCDGVLACDVQPPNCPLDTVPGIRDGCYSGYCIPVTECEAVAECPALEEAGCVNRSDCDAIYRGVDCSCTGNSCQCAEWLFESCEASVDTLPATP